MKSSHEMAQRVLARRDACVAARRRRMKCAAGAAVCVCLSAAIAFGVWQSGLCNADVPLAVDSVQVDAEHGAPVEDSRGTVQTPPVTENAEPHEQETAAAAPPEQTETALGSIDDVPEFSTDVAIGSPLAPAATDLTQDALYEAIGAYLPSETPAGFTFSGATYSEYGYAAFWTRGMEELVWRVREVQDTDAARVTSVADTENYDLALYPIPRAESVPDELREIVNDPIFRADELTQEAVNARAYRVQDAGDSDGWRMQFSVLADEKVISITSKGVSPEWLYAQLEAQVAALEAKLAELEAQVEELRDAAQ